MVNMYEKREKMVFFSVYTCFNWDKDLYYLKHERVFLLLYFVVELVWYPLFCFFYLEYAGDKIDFGFFILQLCLLWTNINIKFSLKEM